MIQNLDTCPICNSKLKSRIVDPLGLPIVYCDHCGPYAMTRQFHDDYILYAKADRSKVASYLYYHNHPRKDTDRLLCICSRVINLKDDYRCVPIQEIENWYPHAFYEKVDFFLLNLSSRSHFLGDLVLFTNETLRAAFFVDVQPKGPMGTYPDAINKQVAFFESYLMEQKYVSKNLSGFTLLPKGLARVDELQKHQSENSKNAFIAMSFADEMDPVRNAIKDALTECGFVPRIMDEIEHNHQIVPEMLHEIREARFLVAELSSGNNGAYYEAGYAAGFGKDVILLFNESVSDKDRHFDVRQTNTIKWKDPDDLKERLVARIKATIV